MREYVTIVTGMPRSGTSLLMQMLGAGGMPLLSDGRRTPDEHNPHGYFEYEPVKRLAADASWVESARGSAVKVIYRLLPHLPAGIVYRVLFAERDLGEVFASQQAMLQSAGHPAAAQDRDRMLRALAAELAAARELLAKRRDATVLYVPYAEVVRDPARWSRDIATFLDGLEEAAMVAAVDPSLRRNVKAS